jgi:hypothetical protein
MIARHQGGIVARFATDGFILAPHIAELPEVDMTRRSILTVCTMIDTIAKHGQFNSASLPAGDDGKIAAP